LFRVGGWFADHTDRRVFGTIGILNGAVFCAIYPFLPSVDVLLALSAFEAIGLTLALPCAQSILTEGADPRQVGRRQGVFSTTQTAAMAVSAMASGALFGLGPGYPFVIMAIASVLVLCSVPFLWRRVPGRVGAAAITPSP
jgi:MFS family permease